jgi:hypothetical protein
MNVGGERGDMIAYGLRARVQMLEALICAQRE